MQQLDIDAATVVSLIYEKVQGPHLYQGLTPGDESNPAKFDICEIELSDHSIGMLHPGLLEKIEPHLQQAVSLLEKQQGDQPAPTTPSFFDLPIPVLLLSKQLQVLQTNDLALDMLTSGIAFPAPADDALAIEVPLKSDILAAASQALTSGISHSLTFNADPGVIRTTVILPQKALNESNAQTVTILFLNHDKRNDKLSAALMAVHGLTQSEANVAAYLAQGLTPEDIASKQKISINTLRTHMKKVFAKTGTSRQSQLVSLILNGPALWMNSFDADSNAPNARISNQTRADSITLSDQRTLSYGDFGPEHGTPVILFHHLFGSRNDRPQDETLLERLGIRLIIPERPGVGSSSPVTKTSLLELAGDARQLIDTLAIERVHVAGLSSGGAHAAAFASLIGDRAINLGIIAGQIPVDELPKGIKVGLVHRLLNSVSRHMPTLAHRQIELNYSKLLADPVEMMSQHKRKTNPADALLYQDLEIHNARQQNMIDAAGRSPSIYAQELIRTSQPWGFRLTELDTPVIFWHGKQDDLFPLDHIAALAKRIPDCSTIFNEQWGHFFPLKEWESIYKRLIQQ